MSTSQDSCFDRIAAYDELVERLGDWAVYSDDLQRRVESYEAAATALAELMKAYSHRTGPLWEAGRAALRRIRDASA